MYLPTLLSFKNKKVAIFGCGNVGKRRAKKLLNAGAEVHIYSKDFDERLLNYGNVKFFKIDLSKVGEEELKNIIKNYDFIVTAVNEEINKKISEIAIKLNKFVNSSTEELNFIIPACVVKEDIIFSIYTGGKSPILAREIRKMVEKYIDKGEIEFIGAFRKFLKDKVKDSKKRREILEKLFTNERFQEELLRLIEKWEDDNNTEG
ncbi:siroheme synthase [Methanocaldococcus infernus ME]|uniref:precorrin-2 dehydrogenase n=1 Tax=Methanocaldococcus infernus (strain DSM 11812 / JCM 15783 / ME) TaxID=573063 RepID=D5VU46_METIM|nr:bifunctional precorrin-2 dehydrogenase/sirohydrochlorin ferrochelatase [Methanocaldococcus infernus]ADG14099.1 siroheme synthase [Methanocaldococcus infernus ME]